MKKKRSVLLIMNTRIGIFLVLNSQIFLMKFLLIIIINNRLISKSNLKITLRLKREKNFIKRIIQLVNKIYY